mmetsp:Transcript_4057/g.13333  ORF Transcript_4057/g.13333 Transcript_4057/m.13333 type:complete len:248 (-) Transcript_4057:151-894(-)
MPSPRLAGKLLLCCSSKAFGKSSSSRGGFLAPRSRLRRWPSSRRASMSDTTCLSAGPSTIALAFESQASYRRVSAESRRRRLSVEGSSSVLRLVATPSACSFAKASSLRRHRVSSSLTSFLATSNAAWSDSTGWKTRFPMDASPVNFLVMRMGSQLSFSLKKFRSVVPGAASKVPLLKSSMIRFTYTSSSRVHFPRRKGTSDAAIASIAWGRPGLRVPFSVVVPRRDVFLCSTKAGLYTVQGKKGRC